MQFDQLLNTINDRTVSLGIGTAAAHLREMEVCLDGQCPSQLLAGMSRQRWQGLLKRASRQLVYQHPSMRPRESKAIAGNRLPPHTIATFPAVITTTRQDRDGDVLETKGAELDPGAPLLWQHLPTEPIGRLLSECKRTTKLLTGSFSICGTPLGEDAALLAEHGALDISHGFLPSKWEPLDEADPLAGYHILEFKILEVSLVSVPSNPDAVIEAFSRKKLQHPLVKAWAGARFARRPVLTASGIDLAPPADKTSRRGEADGSIADGGDCQCGTCQKSRSASGGSADKQGCTFNAANRQRLKAASLTYQAIAAHEHAHAEIAKAAQAAHEKLDGSFAHGGDDGDDLHDYIDDAADEAIDDSDVQQPGKSGRAVSAKNAAVIRQAMAAGQRIQSHPEVTPGIHTMAGEAINHLAAVLASNELTPDDNNAQDDDDGDLGLHGGDPANSDPANATAHARSLLADAQSLLCRMSAYECVTGDATPLKETSQRFREIASKV